MPIVIRDHASLQAAVARGALAGGAAGLAGLFLPLPAAAGAAVALVGLAVAPPRSWPSAALGLWWACVAGAATRIGGYGAVLAVALALGAALGGDQDRLRRAGALLLGALGTVAALWVGRAVLDSAGMGPGFAALAAGALAGGMVGVSSLARHLGREPPHAGLRRLGAASRDELGRLLERAALAGERATSTLGTAAPTARAAAGDLLHRLEALGRRWRELDVALARVPLGGLDERLDELHRRIGACADPPTKTELERAREALLAQRADVTQIVRARERALAQVTHQVAALERLELAAVRHRSSEVGRLGAELEPLVEELNRTGSDLDLAAEALAELG